MRILILGINFTPELTGIGKYTGEMVHYLTQQGHQVHVVTAPPYYPHWRIANGYRTWTYQKETIQGIKVFRCPLWVPKRPRGITRLLHLASFAISSFPIMLAQTLWKPELVFCVAPAIASAPTAWLVARLAGCKAWLHIQDFELDAALNLGMLPGLQSVGRLLQRLERFILNRFDRISTISNRMQTHLINKGIPAAKTSLLLNWVDCDKIFPTSTSTFIRSTWGFSPENLVILYAGNMGHKQGLETLIETARLLQGNQNIRFVLCGEGAAKGSLLKQANGTNNVQFHPLIPADHLNELLNTADAHVLTQRKDASDLVMPSKLTGMLASGRPVIATAHQGTELAEVIQQVGLLVPPEEPRKLAEAIQLLADQPGLRQALGKKGRQYAVTHWSMGTVLNDLNHEVESFR